MTTATYWIVRNDEGLGFVERGDGYFGDANWGFTTYADEYPSRRLAEGLAAEHGGHVVEVTVTERRVGLRWQEPADSMTMLLDGDRLAAIVDGVTFTVSVVGDIVHRITPFDTLDAAKAAAEAAVRESWT